MQSDCQVCSRPATGYYESLLLCAGCLDRMKECDHNWLMSEAGLFEWNTSAHDPFWRDWLQSRELFNVFRNTAQLDGKHLWHVAGGEVFEWSPEEIDCRLQVWVCNWEVMVAYPTAGELYGLDDDTEGPHQFEEWRTHLRTSRPLETGMVRGRCSYGAFVADSNATPTVKWAQAGDWAAAARNFGCNGDKRLMFPR